jgi:hypothetical protein
MVGFDVAGSNATGLVSKKHERGGELDVNE